MVKNPPAMGRLRFDPWFGNVPWRRKWQFTPVFLPGKSHGQRSLQIPTVHGFTKLDMTEGLKLFWNGKVGLYYPLFY